MPALERELDTCRALLASLVGATTWHIVSGDGGAVQRGREPI